MIATATLVASMDIALNFTHVAPIVVHWVMTLLSLQYFTHLETSASNVDPSGILYSNSIVAWNLYFSFFISRRISIIGVSP